MLNWNLRQKVITEKEYQKHLNSLKDLSHLKDDKSSTKDKSGDSNQP